MTKELTPRPARPACNGSMRGRSAILTASACALAFTFAASVPQVASAQWSTTYEQFYLPGKSNWQFRRNYSAADRLFNAFDYGHAILYERLWTKPAAAVSALEEDEYNFITRELLVRPPALPLEEGAIEIAYAKLAPEAKMMFDWAHLLHRQIYDAWADERLTVAQKDARVQELIRYYKTRKELAFSSVPKSMELMEGQPYSLAFRTRYPKFNGLIWAYHWLQVGLYEPLLAGRNKEERQTGVLATVARFRQMIENPPSNMPRVMPMTPAVAPLFTARYPEAAIIFDNLHSMHDVISDILANPGVPRDQKRAEILLAGRRYRDDVSFAMTPPAWKNMAMALGVANMGGPVRGFLAGFPQATLARGAAHGQMSAMGGMPGMGETAASTTGAAGMAGMDHSNMPGMSAAPATPSAQPMQGMDHSNMPGMSPTATAGGAASATAAGSMEGMDHSGMQMDAAGNMTMSTMSMDTTVSLTSELMAMHNAMISDPVIRARVESNPNMKRMMEHVGRSMAAARTAASRRAARASTQKSTPVRKRAAVTAPARRTTRPTTRAATKAPAKTPARAAVKKAPPKPDPMAGMDHSKMAMPKK